MFSLHPFKQVGLDDGPGSILRDAERLDLARPKVRLDQALLPGQPDGGLRRLAIGLVAVVGQFYSAAGDQGEEGPATRAIM